MDALKAATGQPLLQYFQRLRRQVFSLHGEDPDQFPLRLEGVNLVRAQEKVFLTDLPHNSFCTLSCRWIGNFLKLRHALEVRNDSFKCEEFTDMARRHNAAIVFVDSDEYPAIDEATADFAYARLMRTKEDIETGYAAADLDLWAKRARNWAKRGETFIYFISGAKLRAPAAARALMERTD